MKSDLIRKERKVKTLQNRVIELERQLAEAQATIVALTPRQEDKADVDGAQKIVKQQEMGQRISVANEKDFRQAILVAPYHPLMIRREDGKVVMINPAWTEITGYTLEDIPTIGEWTRKAYAEGDCQSSSEMCSQAAVQEGIKKWGEHEITTRSGEKRIWDFSTAPLGVDANGQQLEMVMAVDITERKRAEEALRTSEAKYRSLVETAFEGVWVVDMSGHTTFVNRRMAEMLKYDSPDDLIDHSAFDFVPPEDLDEIKEKFRARLGTNSPEQYDVRLQRRDGSIIWASAAANNVLDENGNITGRMALFMDITKRKRAEEALRKSEERFAKAFQASPDAMIISRMSDGLIMEVNEGLRNLFGYEPAEVLGRIATELNILVDPPDIQKDAIRRLQENGSLRDFEIRIRHKSGAVRLVSVLSERIEINGEECLLNILRDITERKQAEQALRESESRFHSLADSMPQLVWTALPDGTVDYYNQRYQEYQEIKQVEGTAWEWAPVLHPDDLQPTVNAWRWSVETGEIYQIEHRARMADGSYRWHLSRGVPMLDETGRIIRWFGTATDIHDLKMAEEQLKIYAERLERSNRELEQFAFMASHDLQEPLRKIEVFGDLLLERSTSLSGRERNYLDRMRNAAERMRDMVEGLLQLSRVTTQGKPFVRVDLTQVTSEVLNDLEGQIRRVGGKVNFTALPAIEGDPLQLRRLLQNLIGNALKYHRPDMPPDVKVYAKELSGKVQIYVEDKGIGFDQADAERIFKPFQRLVGRSQYEGSGIGLAICRRIIERHGGEIGARSKPGHGATFIVTLPIHPPGSARSEVRKDANDEDPGTTFGR